MKISEKDGNLSQKRCTVCRRSRKRAIKEQVEQFAVCGIDRCPFPEDITDAIRHFWKAELLEFELSHSTVLEGSYVDITWHTKNCNRVFITNYGEAALSGSKRIQATLTTYEVELVLEDLFGDISATRKSLKVLPLPTLELLDYTGQILKGESFYLHYAAACARSIQLQDEEGNVIADLSGGSTYSSPPLEADRKWHIYVEGENGGSVRQEIAVSVFEPPVIGFFKCNSFEKTDASSILLEFECQYISKAEIAQNGVIIAEVTDTGSYTHMLENKTGQLLTFQYELIVTSLTGKTSGMALAAPVSVYPRPSVSLRSQPFGALLFPEQITIFNEAKFCEKILFSDGVCESIISPDTELRLAPDKNTAYTFTPVSKQGLRGEPETLFVEVCYPVELTVTCKEKITLQNLPVTISWQAKNHSDVFIEPGNINVTHLSSYDLRLDSKTRVTVIASNKRDRKEVTHFIDVLQHQRASGELLNILPKVDLRFPKVDLHIPQPGNIIPRVDAKTITQKALQLKIPAGLFKKDLTLKQIIPRADPGFQRNWRQKMFKKLQSIK